jgi:hypothetical protein
VFKGKKKSRPRVRRNRHIKSSSSYYDSLVGCFDHIRRKICVGQCVQIDLSVIPGRCAREWEDLRAGSFVLLGDVEGDDNITTSEPIVVESSVGS